MTRWSPYRWMTFPGRAFYTVGWAWSQCTFEPHSVSTHG